MSEEKEVLEKKKKEVTLESVSKGLLINRIIGASSLLVLFGIFVIAALAYKEVDSVLVETKPYVERLQTLDFDGIENSITEINVFVEKTDFDHLSQVVESVPVDLFEQVNEIEAYLEQIASFAEMKDDISLTMDNFNNFAVKFEEFQKRMEPLLKLFSK